MCSSLRCYRPPHPHQATTHTPIPPLPPPILEAPPQLPADTFFGKAAICGYVTDTTSMLAADEPPAEARGNEKSEKYSVMVDKCLCYRATMLRTGKEYDMVQNKFLDGYVKWLPALAEEGYGMN